MIGGRRAPENENELDDVLSTPHAATLEALRRSPGDIVILGAGGKMGPTLALLAARAAKAADQSRPRRVIAVSRFKSAGSAEALERAGIETISCDLLDSAAVERLPDAPNVVFMAGQKFGTSDAPHRTWMMNVVVPEQCARRYSDSRIVAFSTGNVYPLVPVSSGGASETTMPAPLGEYAASCLGRERVFEYYSATRGSRIALLRLNYAIDLRYGVLTDLALRILASEPVPLAMGYVNIIWQGDANSAALELLPLASSPPLIVNVSGATTLSIRSLATELGKRLDRLPRFDGVEKPDALLSDTSFFRSKLGDPETPLDVMLDWVAEWVREGRPVLGKPTKFEARDGAF